MITLTFCGHSLMFSHFFREWSLEISADNSFALCWYHHPSQCCVTIPKVNAAGSQPPTTYSSTRKIPVGRIEYIWFVRLFFWLLHSGSLASLFSFFRCRCSIALSSTALPTKHIQIGARQRYSLIKYLNTLENRNQNPETSTSNNNRK